MLQENLVRLRNMYGYSQERIAEKVGVSRQAYAKWEAGAAVPDVNKCKRLADEYGVTVDGLLKSEELEGGRWIPPAPVGKAILGTVTVNDRGQIVIPKAAREAFDLTAGARLVVLTDERGIALMPAERFEEQIREMLEYASRQADEQNGGKDHRPARGWWF